MNDFKLKVRSPQLKTEGRQRTSTVHKQRLEEGGEEVVRDKCLCNRGSKTLKSHKDMYITTSTSSALPFVVTRLILPKQRRAATASLEPRHKTCGMSLPLGSDADTLCLYVSVMIIALKHFRVFIRPTCAIHNPHRGSS